MTKSEYTLLQGPYLPELLKNETLPDLFEATAKRLPNKTALIFENESLTYAELNAKADIVAHHLIQRGVVSGAMVGLWMHRGISLLVAQLGIAKAGAAWLPMDADLPADRVEICIDDAKAVGIITDFELPAGTQIPAWSYQALCENSHPPLLKRCGHTHTMPAYVIYTSGSTGKPKGICINQGSISHFLRSENHQLGITEGDKVYQGFSVAFDMSFEEIWISYLVGATLWIAPKSLIADPQALPTALRENQITVLHAVPTLLALFAEDVPNLRLINLGGEMCPESVVERWWTPNRQMFNTYGPTEATVSASLASLVKGQPVTIGTPLPNYGLLVMNEQGEALPAGQTGELCIFGPGVSDGYLGRADLTAEKFIRNPYATRPDEERLYKTGDLAIINEDGSVQCLGRADDQIKIRGFRVELGEIEAALCDIPGIGTAAVILKAINGMDQLVAFIASEEDTPPSISELRQHLKQRLPVYMVPAFYEYLAEVPRLTSGKIDRKVLKAKEITLSGLLSEDEDQPQNETEQVIFDTLKKLFPGHPIRLSADFFDDMGGHSLLAARMVSELRAHPLFETITVQDIYQLRSIGKIAEKMHLVALHNQKQSITTKAPNLFNSTWRRLRCGVAQLVAIPVLVAFRILSWLAPFVTYHMLTGDEGDSMVNAMLISVGVFLLGVILSFILPVLGVRALQGHLKPGKYPLWGIGYFRWWLSNRLTEVIPVHLISGSSLYPLYLRAMGAKIGEQVVIGSVTIRAPSLLTIEDKVSIGSSVNLENAHIENGELEVGTIHLAESSYIGSYAVLSTNTKLETLCHVEGLSAVPSGETLQAKQRYQGAPAKLVGAVDMSTYPKRPLAQQKDHLLRHLFYILGALLMAVVFFIPIFPTFVLVDWIDFQWLHIQEQLSSPIWVGIIYFLVSIPACLLLVVITALVSSAIRWTVLPRLSPSSWPVHGSLYYRKWLTNQIQEASLFVLHGIYATLYAPTWYRLLGAKIGKGTEVSTAMGVVPDMLTLGKDAFIADAVMLGDDEINAGWMSINHTVVGDRTFVGNGAYIPDGTVLPPEVLIGVQSTIPNQQAIRPGDTWMGSPSLRLPARESLFGFSDELTFSPSWKRRVGRGIIEAARIVLPQALTICAGYLIVLDLLPIVEEEAWVKLCTHLAIDGALYGALCFVIIWVLKWLFIGRYEPKAAPMWTMFVWTSEAVTNLYESIAVPNFVNFLRGTPFLPWALRLMGAKIGKGTYLDTTDITEFDCAYIGDNVEMNALTGPQTHLFEDRIMKIGNVHIGKGTTVHPRGTILYDAKVGNDVVLGPLSLVMKGETLPANSRWMGTPTSPWLPRTEK
ncbi:amino acid adenylation domain-containing protein [Leeia sp. TBRC 13508]|uniref:Amino acid adenylation domain-containing protein n=1 Tax=Leeia speluncae TaxID=2884804 RepID=A0ABS8D9I6_9NEIS|nr:Pls/PosA family non-ribosomal peptide synthetase [Leeia speluncae]MCB6184855.1 amino acid adenylation domain-containing protein [Leeia speluncae]